MKGSTLVLALAICLLFISQASALFGRRNSEYGMVPPPGSDGTFSLSIPVESWFTQVLDHFDNTSYRTWKQRFFVNDEFETASNPTAPVYVYIGSEGTLSSKWVTQGYMYTTARKTGGLMLALEHRFYGSSQPMPDWTPESLRFLSSSQALADLAYFIKSYNFVNRPVVVFGGSYGGSLAAWMRIKYPHLVHMALASSAPLEPKIDFTQYLEVANDALKWYGGDKCVDAFTSATRAISVLLNSDAGAAELTRQLKLCTPLVGRDRLSIQDLQNFWASLSDSFAGVVQYNKENSPSTFTVKNVCETFENIDASLAAFYNVMENIRISSRMECMEWSFGSLVRSLNGTKVDNTSNMRQWMWQTCTEFGFYQTSTTVRTFGEPFDLRLFDSMCKAAYGGLFDMDFLGFNVKKTNATYGSIDFRASNTVFTNGNIDPWHALSVLKETPKLDIHSIMTPGTSHCAILYGAQEYDIKPIIEDREKVSDIMMSILKKFYN